MRTVLFFRIISRYLSTSLRVTAAMSQFSGHFFLARRAIPEASSESVQHLNRLLRETLRIVGQRAESAVFARQSLRAQRRRNHRNSARESFEQFDPNAGAAADRDTRTARRMKTTAGHRPQSPADRSHSPDPRRHGAAAGRSRRQAGAPPAVSRRSAAAHNGRTNRAPPDSACAGNCRETASCTAGAGRPGTDKALVSIPARMPALMRGASAGRKLSR